MGPEAQALMTELSQKLAYHSKWGSFDFIFVQVMLWFAILASVLSTIFASLPNVSKWLTVPIAAVPALALAAETTFNFSGRALWQDEYVVGLERMIRSLKIDNEDPKLVNKQFAEFEVKMREKFPAIRTTALKPGGTQGNPP